MVYSDHAPFWDHGYSAVCGITDNEGSCCHGRLLPLLPHVNDTLANCGAPAFFYGAVKAYVATVAHLAEPLCGGGAFPPVPTGVKRPASGDNRITVSWASGGASIQYEVLRARGGCGGAFAARRHNHGETSWSTPTSPGSVTYAYRVRARLAASVSPS